MVHISTYTLALHPPGWSERGAINNKLPLELIAKIWSMLPITDLLRYGATSRWIYDTVQNAIRDTVHRVLGQYFSDTTSFLSTLVQQRAVVSGSAVLQMMLSVSFEHRIGGGLGWNEGDMDIYVPTTEGPEGEPRLLQYLISKEGYTVAHENKKKIGSYSPYAEIKDIITLTKGTNNVDLIVSATRFSVSPVFRFHTTVVMNFMTGTAIFSAYPEMTCRMRGLVNPSALTLDLEPPAFPPIEVRDALKKYAHRGFDIRYNPSCWNNDKHICTRTSSCPHTLRTVQDASCLVASIRSLDVETGISTRSESISDEVQTLGVYQIQWHLGGRSCDGKRIGMQGFVSCHAQYEPNEGHG